MHARVYPENPDEGRRPVTLPMPAAHYRLPVPPDVGEFPREWCLHPDTDGMFARVTDAANRPLAATDHGEAFRFEVDDPEGPAQCLLNAFYLCSLAHDLFLLLGFDGPSKNFEMIGAGHGGRHGDPVVVRVRDDSDCGEAHMTCRPDGEPPIMVLGRNRATGRPTALDADVVLHEYVHGVTTRLVGGPGNPASLEAVQSAALGEGWSDYFALTLQNHLHRHRPARTRLGTWSTGCPDGLRLHAYDEHFPATFADVGTGRYVEPHAIGEIWAATLIEMHRVLAVETGDRVVGDRLGWRVVLDGLRLTPCLPSVLDGRDAILDAAADIDAAHLVDPDDGGGRPDLVSGRTLTEVLWAVFARFGMGRTARGHGPDLDGIVGCERA